MQYVGFRVFGKVSIRISGNGRCLHAMQPDRWKHAIDLTQGSYNIGDESHVLHLGQLCTLSQGMTESKQDRVRLHPDSRALWH